MIHYWKNEEHTCEMWASAPAPLPLRPSNGYSSIESLHQRLKLHAADVDEKQDEEHVHVHVYVDIQNLARQFI